VWVDDRFVYCLLHQWVRLCSNPPQYFSFSLAVSAVSSKQAILSKNSKKTNPRRGFRYGKIRGVFQMPPMMLASLPRFLRSQGRGF
jgi:hypothetical protein